MDRRDVLRSLFFRTSTANPVLNDNGPVTEEAETFRPVVANSFKSKWHLLPGTGWAAENICCHSLKDWCLKKQGIKLHDTPVRQNGTYAYGTNCVPVTVLSKPTLFFVS